MLSSLFFYLKYTRADLFQEIRLSQKLNQENGISKQDKKIFLVKNMFPSNAVIKCRYQFCRAVCRVLQKTYLKTREGEILIMFDPVTKDPKEPENVPRNRSTLKFQIFDWSRPTFGCIHYFPTGLFGFSFFFSL